MKVRVTGVLVFFFLFVIPVLAAEVKTANVNGTKLSYVETGQGEPVVLIHGALSDYRVWDDEVRVLAAKYRVIAVSLRYHTPNAWPKKLKSTADYNASTHAADVSALIQQLKLGKVNLVGHSYGAAIAALVATSHPELIKSLVLAEPSLPTLLPDDEQGRSIRSALQKASADALTLAQQGDEERAVRTWSEVAAGPGAFDKLPEHSQAILFDNARTLTLLLSTGMPQNFSCADAGSIKTRTLIVTAEGSPAYYHLVAKEFGRCSPGAQQAAVPGYSHAISAWPPDALTAVIANFVAQP